MSRTNRGSKGSGYEYGSRRYTAYFLDPGKDSKRRTNKYDRREAKAKVAQVEEQLICNQPVLGSSPSHGS